MSGARGRVVSEPCRRPARRGPGGGCWCALATVRCAAAAAGGHQALSGRRRDDVSAAIAHQMPTVARSWPSRSGYLPWEHVGHTYRATYPLQAEVVAVQIVPALPKAFVRVEEVLLVSGEASASAAPGHQPWATQHRLPRRGCASLCQRGRVATRLRRAVGSGHCVGRDVWLGDVDRQALLPVEVVSYQTCRWCCTPHRSSAGGVERPRLSGWVAVWMDCRPRSGASGDRARRATAGSHEISLRYHPLKLTLR